MKLITLAILIIQTFGNYSISDNNMRYITNLTKHTYKRELGIVLDIGLEQWGAPQPNLNMNIYPVNVIDALYQWMRDLSLYPRKKPIFVSLPPMVDDSGNRYIGGVTQSGCALSADKVSVAIGNAMKENQNGVGRLYNSSVILMHELAHQLHASHDDRGPNIMHPNANIFVADRPLKMRLRFNQRAKNQARKCLMYGF